MTDSFESIEVVIQEAMSDLYENHNQSFDDLNMLDDITLVAYIPSALAERYFTWDFRGLQR